MPPLGADTSRFAPGNDMHMGMFNGLTGSQSVVHADIEAVGLEFRE